jgi:glycosyltransferase involved in cell wall biosynthesis
MKTPRVSVIMPCYNGAAYLRDAVDSVLGQTYQDFELIVVNDGSTDDSADILAGYGDRIRVVYQANAGLPQARNAGLQAGRGELVAFLDADDYWDSRFLDVMVGALASSDAGIAYCGWQNVGLPGGRGAPYVPPDYEALPEKAARIFENTPWPVHAALVRKHLVDGVGGFDPRLPACEDFALWVEIATAARLVRVPEVLAYYRHHGGSQMTARRAVVALSHWRVQQDFLRRHPERGEAWGRRLSRRLTHGELLRRGYESYWRRDLPAARAIFRRVMASGFGAPRDWIYMLPSLLPLPVHRFLVGLADRPR